MRRCAVSWLRLLRTASSVTRRRARAMNAAMRYIEASTIPHARLQPIAPASFPAWHKQVIDAFEEVAVFSTDSTPIDEILRLIGRRMCELLDLSRCSVYLRREDGTFQAPFWQYGAFSYRVRTPAMPTAYTAHIELDETTPVAIDIPDGRIAGTVRDAKSGAAVAGVSVALQTNAGRTRARALD